MTDVIKEWTRCSSGILVLVAETGSREWLYLLMLPSSHPKSQYRRILLLTGIMIPKKHVRISNLIKFPPYIFSEFILINVAYSNSAQSV